MSAKVFIVTGASKGIGAAVVQQLLRDSHKVVLSARSQALLEGVKASHPASVEFIAGDITSPNVAADLVALAVKAFGRLDGMVINHGMLETKKFADTTLDNIKHLYDVNVFSCAAMAQAGIVELRKTKGCMVWVSSGAALKAYTAWSAYGSSKAAMNSISAHVALEEPDLSSIAVGPGRVNTEMQGFLRTGGKDTMDKTVYDTFVDAYNAGELLAPERPGNVIAKLVAEPIKELSGRMLSWNSPELAKFTE